MGRALVEVRTIGWVTAVRAPKVASGWLELARDGVRIESSWGRLGSVPLVSRVAGRPGARRLPSRFLRLYSAPMSSSTPISQANGRSALIAHPAAGSLTPVRIGVRARASRETPPAQAPPAAEFVADGLASGARRVAGVEIECRLEHQAEAATLECAVRNVSGKPKYLDSVIFGFRWQAKGASEDPLRFLRHGWQSWSYTGVRELDAAGQPEFPSGPWLRGMHHARNAPPADRSGWHESATVSVVGRARRAKGGVCLVGALETGRAFALVYLRESGGRVDVEIEQVLEVSLEPGESRPLEDVRIALGAEPSRMLEAFATLWGRAGGARTHSPFQAGWCSWYYFFHDVTEEDLLRNLDALVDGRRRATDELPVEVVQLDDGYQRAIGDWLITNEKFPSGLAPLAQRIRDAGFRAGIWTAPFCVVPESLLFEAHPEWLLRWGDKPFNGTFHTIWTPGGAVHALDTARADVQQHLRALFSELVSLGFDYLKLDFLHAAAMLAESEHPEVSRAARLRLGLEAVRAGAGEDALLLGCGSPLGPAVGVVDAMRIGPDVAPHWGPPAGAIPGIEPALPSTHGAVRSVLSRSWMHRRLWLNDPDCLMVRDEDTELTREEAHTLATAIAATGGMAVVSDELSKLSETERARIRDTISAAREVDASGEVGTARCLDFFASEAPQLVWAESDRSDSVLALLNTDDAGATQPASVLADVGANGLAPQLAATTQVEALLDTRGASPADVTLAPHESALFRLRHARELAVFCDFDGTFSVQDVGASIADRHAGANRPRMRELFLRGDVTAWESNMELLDGLPLPESALDEFLHTIELDPGAKSLVDWCRKRDIPFQILSDGFDYNLDRLQEIHGVSFAYAANRLRYAADCWRIEAGHPNPACGCGTGSCKRAQIDAYRDSHPASLIVHIGNGRVSDLCGALTADLTFAKDTLAPALEAMGERFVPFVTLHDVVERLSALLD